MIKKEFDSMRHLGFLFDSTSREIKKAVGRGVIENNEGQQCNMKLGWLLGYLDRQEQAVFQKDLEKTLHIPKSTLADMIQEFEKSGYIAKVPVDGDGRKKQIVLTEQGKKFTELAEAQIIAVDEYITQGISEEEIESVVSVLDKMRQNAMEYKSYIDICNKED